MSVPIYEIQSLTHSYGGSPVLSIDHLTVQPASIVGLIGPNGSGKSSLLRLLGLIEKPTVGKIHYNGHRVEPFSEAVRFQVTLLPQEPFLMKRSVLNNVSYGLKLRGGNGRDAARRVAEALAMVGLPFAEFARRPWYALSGGEAQRVALAARLALIPKVLLLDEPTASVDAASAQLIKEASLKARREWGTTLIVASHDWQWLHEICDDILHLFKGIIFGKSRETIVFGPWQALGANRWGKVLSPHQQLWVPEPPSPDAAAVLDILPVDKEDPPLADEEVVLNGVISRLGLERKTGQLVATILVEDLPFSIGLTMQQGKADALFPGKTISIRYRLDQVRWI